MSACCYDRESSPSCCFSHSPAVAPALAQDTGTAQQSKYGNFHVDAIGREEWTRDVPVGDGTTKNESRWSIQARPRYEVTFGPFDLGVGAAINYSQDRNDEPPQGGSLTIIRDNYRSRDLRLDLAYARVRLGPVTAQGGRFVMPLSLTEMVWDRELRPQGGAASVSLGAAGSSRHFALTAIYATGSHVFEDKSVMYGGGAELTLATGTSSGVQLVGSYLQFDKLDELDPVLGRQNTILGGHFRHEYRVADAVVRLQHGRPDDASSPTTAGTPRSARTTAASGSLPRSARGDHGGAGRLHLREDRQGCDGRGLQRRRLLLGHRLGGPPLRDRPCHREEQQRSRDRAVAAAEGRRLGHGRSLGAALAHGVALELLADGHQRIHRGGAMARARVAILRTKPDRVLDDYARLFELAGGPRALARGATTILKDNISWHYPFPSANTTPWQLEGDVLALRQHGFDDLVCVQNKTEVTDAFKGEDLNRYRPIFEAYGIPVLFNFRERRHALGRLRAQGEDAGARPHLRRAICASPTTSSARTSSTCRRSSATSTRPRPAR